MSGSTSKSVRLALIQMRCVESAEANMEVAVDALQDASQHGAHVACLPELFLGPYFCQSEDPAVFDRAEPIPGPSSARLAEVAQRTGLTLIAPLFERRAAGIYHNSLVVLEPNGSPIRIYRKMHIPDDPLFYEKYYFTPGDLGFQTVPTQHANLGPLICWDQWYPEAARLTALRGAEILFYPTAIGWHPSEKAEFGDDQFEAWRIVQRGHAIANGVFVAAINRVGHEGPVDGGIEFWGGSFVADPFGRIIAEAGSEPETLVVDCDLGRIEETRRHWPFLRDRRIDAYQGLDRRWLGRGPNDPPVATSTLLS